ncbi:hypothetical protein BY458DRAFT_573980 [Sporodiniella umbellata]|nr:hypothetical protein BY458DRAFT_573980 [Sporodiniella umbellata]
MSDSSSTIHPFFQPRKIKTDTPQSSPSPRKKVKQTTLSECKPMEEIAPQSSLKEPLAVQDSSAQNNEMLAEVPSVHSNEMLAETLSATLPERTTIPLTETIVIDRGPEVSVAKQEAKPVEQTKKLEAKKHFAFTKKQKPVYPKLLSEEPLKAESSCATLQPLQLKNDLPYEEFNFYGRVRPKQKKARYDNEFSRLDRSIYRHGHWPARVRPSIIPIAPIVKLENKHLLKNAIQIYTPFADRPQTQPSRLKCDRKHTLLGEKMVHSWLDQHFPGWCEFPSCVRLLRRAMGPKTSETSQQRWIEKYRPNTVDGLLGAKHNHAYLKNWLHKMKIEPTLSQEKSPKPVRRNVGNEENNVFKKMMEQQNKIDQDDDDFIDTSTSSRKTTKQKPQQHQKPTSSNMVLIVGDYGVGKTALVYTAAEQEKYEIFEMNSGSRRSGKDVVSTLGEMTKSHLVTFHNKKVEQKVTNEVEEIKKKKPKLNPLLSSMRINGLPFEKRSEDLSCFIRKKTDTALSKSHLEEKSGPKQSLILLEEVDLLFEEDKGFWSALVELSQTSKRPIIMTCNDPDQVPFEILTLQTVLYIKPPELEEILPYLWLICYAEGYVVDPADLICLVSMVGCDLRHLIQILELYRDVPNPFETISGLYPRMSLYEKQAAYIPFKSTDNYQITNTYRSAVYEHCTEAVESENLEGLVKRLEDEAFIDTWLEIKEHKQMVSVRCYKKLY